MRLGRTLVLAFLLTQMGCVFYGDYRDLEKRFESNQAALEEAHREIHKWKRDAEVAQVDVRTKTMQVSYASQESELLREEIARLSGGPGGGAVTDTGLEFNPRTHGLVISSEVLFASGRHELSESGKKALRDLSPKFREIIGRGSMLRIDGHTDDQKISKSKDRYKDNWELGFQRARTVREFLVSQGLPAEGVAIGVFAETMPINPGSSDVARKKNRRVEVVVIDR